MDNRQSSSYRYDLCVCFGEWEGGIPQGPDGQQTVIILQVRYVCVVFVVVVVFWGGQRGPNELVIILQEEGCVCMCVFREERALFNTGWTADNYHLIGMRVLRGGGGIQQGPTDGSFLADKILGMVDGQFLNAHQWL